MKSVELIKGIVTEVKRGTWFFSDGGWVAVFCPDCESLSAIARRNDEPHVIHNIDKCGVVEPVVLCPWPSCEWFAEVKLLEWDGFQKGN